MAVAESVGGIVQHVLEDSLHVALFGAAQLFAPHSLILADEVRWQPHSQRKGSRGIVVAKDGILQTGDIVLVATPGAVFDVYREGIVVAPGVVLHVGPPRIRLLPTSTVLRSRAGLAVLRPASPDLPAPVPAGASQPSTAESHASRLQRMTDAVLQLVGEKYAGVRALGLVGRLLAEGAVGHPGLPPLPAPDGPGDEELTRPAPKSRIQLGRCALREHFPSFKAALVKHRRKLRMRSTGVSIPDDLWTLHCAEPGLFTHVHVPLPSPQPVTRVGPASRPGAGPQQGSKGALRRLVLRALRLAQVPGAVLTAGVRTLPDAATRGLSLLLYTLTFLALSRGWVAALLGPAALAGPLAALALIRKVALAGVVLMLMGVAARQAEEAL
ncbi:unnamed protein product, partial [Symbiodinium sp. KB8]